MSDNNTKITAEEYLKLLQKVDASNTIDGYTTLIENIEKKYARDEKTQKLLSYAYTQRGAQYVQQQNEQVIQDYTRPFKINPNLSNTHFSKDSQQKKYKLAEKDFNHAIMLNPQYVNAYVARGMFYQQQKKYDLAEQDFTHAIMLNPQYAEAYVGRGVCYQQQKQYDLAEQDFNLAIILNPKLATAYYNRGLFYQQQQKHDLAAQDFNHAITLNSKSEYVYYNRILLYQQQNFDLAESGFNKIVQLESDNAMAYVCRGLFYQQKQNFDLAEKDFNHAIKINPLLVAAYFSRGLFYQQQQNFDLAEKDFNHAIKINPQYVNAYVARGNLYTQQQNFDLAKKDFRKAIKLNETGEMAYFSRGFMFEKKGKKEKKNATNDLKKAIEIIMEKKCENIDNLHLYKYRSINMNTLNMLLSQTIWLANPDTFNDPFDCQRVKKSAEEHSPILYDIFNNIGIISFEGGKPPNDNDSTSHEGGKNTLMWSHYADGHKGICIIYEVKKNTKSYISQVAYVKEHKLGYKNDSNYFQVGFEQKHKNWQYENEYRLIKYSEQLGYGKPLLIKNIGLTIKGIIFGLHCSEEDKNHIRKLLDGFKITYYKTKQNEKENSFELLIEEYPNTATNNTTPPTFQNDEPLS